MIANLISIEFELKVKKNVPEYTVSWSKRCLTLVFFGKSAV